MYRSLFFATLILIYSCQQTPQRSATLTDSERTVIVDSIKGVINQFIKGCEEVNADDIIRLCSNTDRFRAADQEAHVYPSDSLNAIVRRHYSGLLRQDLNATEPFINVLNQDYAEVITSGDFTATLKDSSTMGGPFAWTMVLTHESGQWKVLSLHQSIKWREPSPKK